MPAHLHDRGDCCIDLKSSCFFCWRSDDIFYKWIHHRSADDDESEAMQTLFPSEPFVFDDTGCDESTTNKKEAEDEKCVFDFFLCFWRLYAHKWHIDNRTILWPPEKTDDEKTWDDMHSSYCAVFWTLRDELCEFDKSRIHRKKENLVPRAGLEPAHREVRDFKSLVSTISPPGQIILWDYYIVFLFFSRDLLRVIFFTKIRQICFLFYKKIVAGLCLQWPLIFLK